MNTVPTSKFYPDLFSSPTAHTFGANWDTLAVARIVRDKSSSGKTPAFLFLGRTEIELLRAHLANAFGEDSVTTLNETYYMGLKVVPVDSEAYICTGGSKAQTTVQAPKFHQAS